MAVWRYLKSKFIKVDIPKFKSANGVERRKIIEKLKSYNERNLAHYPQYLTHWYKENKIRIDDEELKKEIEATDPLDLEPLVGLDIDEEGRAYFPSIRGVAIKPNKYYKDENKTPRIDFTFKSEDRGRTEAILYMTPTEKYLSEIIDELPYGLIDKQITGIGATHLEMYSKRNSIIVLPTRVLAKSKASKETRFLYVGTKEDGKVTSDREIIDYLNNHQNEDKKFFVVADSLKRVIKVIQSTGEDVYRNYFLMVDEIDTLQSDNHFRPQLSIVIDYYFKLLIWNKQVYFY